MSDSRKKALQDLVISGSFYDAAKKEVTKDLVQKGKTIAYFWPTAVKIKKEDQSLIQPVFEKLKQDFPELNHFRIFKHGEIAFDTKKNTLFRRMTTNLSASPAI